jgi:Flp pilus assembly protein TadD
MARPRVRWAWIAAAAVIAAAFPVAALAKGSKKKSPPKPPVADPPPPPSRGGSKGNGDSNKRKPSSGGTGGSPEANPDAGRSAKSRARYLALRIADDEADRLDEFLGAAEDGGLAAELTSCSPRVRTTIEVGLELGRQGRWRDALTSAETLLSTDNRSAAGHLLAGRALGAIGGDADAAQKHFEAAVAAAPSDPYALHARGIAAWRAGELDDAKKDLAAALAMKPADGRLLLSQGAIAWELRDLPGSAASLLAATDARPGDAEAWRALGRTLTSCEDWAGAIASFERAVRILETPAGGPSDPAPAQAAGRATDLHLWLAILDADRLQDAAAARAHATAFLGGGGLDLALDEWVRGLMGK